MNQTISVVAGLGIGVLVGLFVPFGIAMVLTVGFILIAVVMRPYATVALMALLGMIGVTLVKVYMWNQSVGLT